METRPYLSIIAWVCLGGIQAARADGQFELRQDMMPITISEPGVYQAVEDLSLGTVFIPTGATWRYLDDGSDQGTAWREPGFDDSNWSAGPARLGFGDRGLATELDDNNQITSYFRNTFVVEDPLAWGDLELLISSDDGFAAYLNGTEVARHNLPGGTLSYDTEANVQVSGLLDEIRYLNFDVEHTLLAPGTNTFAIEVHNWSASNSDLTLGATLTASSGSANGNGITITADGVLLDLNGFCLRGAVGETEDGVRIDTHARNVEVRNGTICQWGDNGIDAGVVFPTQAATGSVFRELRVCDNFRDGIKAGPNTFVDRVHASSNGRLNADSGHEVGVGIKVYQGSLVSECIVMDNHSHGILPRSRSEVHNCIIFRNSHDGIHAGSHSLITGCVIAQGLAGSEGVEVYEASAVMRTVTVDNAEHGMRSKGPNVMCHRNTAVGNAADGIKVAGSGNLVIENSTVANGDDGVSDLGGSLVFRNNSHDNAGGTGLKAIDDGNWIHNNHVIHNGNGIELESGGSLVTENSASGNTSADYAIGTGNQTGPFVSSPSNAAPWVNFEY